MNANEKFLKAAIELARKNVLTGGRPFGAVIVFDGAIIAEGVNEIGATKDPTTHAELQAIRKASRVLLSPNLEGCVVYASGNPCPMCLSAMYLSGIKEVHFAYSNAEGEAFGLSTEKIYNELKKPFDQQSLHIHHAPVKEENETLYEFWKKMH